MSIVTNMKTCRYCNLELPLEQFHAAKRNKDGLSWKCKACTYSYWKEWYNNPSSDAKEKNKERNKKFHYTELGQKAAFKKRLARYNLTEAEYDALWERSQGLCEICKKVEATDIDHCHSSGKVRGLLCADHNRALGSFQDSVEVLQSAIEYLKR